MIVRLRSLLSFAMAFGALAHTASGQDFTDHTSFPNGIRGERIAAVIDAVNQNRAGAVEAFLASHVTASFHDRAPLEAHVDAFAGAYRQTKGIEFHSIRTYEPARDETVVIVQDQLYGGWHSIVLNFDDADGRISGIRFTPARAPTDVVAPTQTRAELVEAVRQAVDRGCSMDAFSGTVLVAADDEVLFEAACGEASKRYGVANDIDTKFNLGSMNKMFTSLAIMQLVEEGLLRLDTPVSEHVDETWLPRGITERITIHHLLSHTSGLGSYFNDTFMKSSRGQFRELSDYKPLVQGDTLAFEPGSRFGYSNTGMLLLGVVIESVTGQSYFDYIREHVYEPAGMSASDSYSMDEPVPNLAIGYIPDPASKYGWRNNIFEHVMKGGPAGGGFSTVRDLHRFARALVSGRLASSESTEKMWTSQSEASYGYGFQISTGSAGKVVGHGGGFPGLNGNLDIFIDSGFVVAVLSNYDRAASPLADHIKQLIGRVEAL